MCIESRQEGSFAIWIKFGEKRRLPQCLIFWLTPVRIKSSPNDNLCAASGVQAAKWPGYRIVGELLPSVQGRCVCKSRESIWDSGEPGCLPHAATSSKPGNYLMRVSCFRENWHFSVFFKGFLTVAVCFYYSHISEICFFFLPIIKIVAYTF